ncbi:MAG: hypothetical protein OMM_04915 [Candidatus Magnetoglobus multicellularis str. Araruama]|uniref:HEPN domain-containing protein n=1 Tax=Candidatus Magnetoglobus multicellularis str. Araruama TaxID=890399 RepID=A0A1V1NZ14_9BACT|nr:MAG: hypothetical protein OMM_04915 [Candidatus Magnetoglobus multicellularis str. Araruama]
MLAKDKDWARGYAKQALSDLDAREILVRGNAEKCHRLHFHQMAAEKMCKAYLTVANGHENVKKIHAYVARNLPIIARQFYSVKNDNNEISRWEISEIKRLSREIEILAPACDHGDLRKDNSEYPWQDGNGKIQTPCEYKFSNINDGSRAITRLIRLIREASEYYSR